MSPYRSSICETHSERESKRETEPAIALDATRIISLQCLAARPNRRTFTGLLNDADIASNIARPDQHRRL
jgi:hypothetical protein